VYHGDVVVVLVFFFRHNPNVQLGPSACFLMCESQ
jgi:hypothetical protein